jgi:hypothetical protein
MIETDAGAPRARDLAAGAVTRAFRAAAPERCATAAAAVVAGLPHAPRLARWRGHRTGAGPLLMRPRREIARDVARHRGAARMQA